MIKSIITTSLRQKMKEHFDSVSLLHEVMIVPRKKDEDAFVIVSLKEYNSLIETGHILSKEANRKRIWESIAHVDTGDTVSLDN